jgi:hypothetical protein
MKDRIGGGGRRAWSRRFRRARETACAERRSRARRRGNPAFEPGPRANPEQMVTSATTYLRLEQGAKAFSVNAFERKML